MSDAGLRSEASAGDEGRARPTGVRLGEAGAAAAGAAGLTPPLPQGPQPEAAELGVDDSQPMLDLRFPDSPQPDARSPNAEPAPSATATGPDQNSSPSPPPDAVVEITPIFSALDAAEKAFARSQEHASIAAMPPDIMLPRPPSFSDGQFAPPIMDGGPAHTNVALDHAALPEAEADSATASETNDARPPADDRAEQLHDAATKIAEEANATAEALESLKRLLNHKLPLLDSVSPPSTAPEADIEAELNPPPPPVPAYEALPAEPIMPPPMVPLAPTAALAEVHYSEPPRRRARVAVGGFLAGFALSWVFGAVLYAYLTMG
jgi:hypothetical protein